MSLVRVYWYPMSLTNIAKSEQSSHTMVVAIRGLQGMQGIATTAKGPRCDEGTNLRLRDLPVVRLMPTRENVSLYCNHVQLVRRGW